ncbi:MAG TPA: hypothetical protein VL943_07355, partial [Niabella sp.]|nr:hypothetical protein [Niabella sp.]
MFKLIACCYVFFFYVVTANAQNLLNVQEWIPGTGGTVSFTVNGSTTENSREWGTAPDGSRAVLWKASPLGDINGDGGWHTAAVGINKQMM